MQPSSNPQHPDSSIVLYQHGLDRYLLAFRDCDKAVAWLTALCNTWHRDKRTRKIVQELIDMVYMMPARHTRKGNVQVSEDQPSQSS